MMSDTNTARITVSNQKGGVGKTTDEKFGDV